MLLNLIKHKWSDIDKIYLYIKDPFESKYPLLINGREKKETENLKNPKAFINYSQTIDDVYEDLEHYHLTKKRITSFISQSYFRMPKIMILNATHYFIMKIPNKREK